MKSLCFILIAYAYVIAGERLVEKLKFNSADSVYVGAWVLGLGLETCTALGNF
ncbi:MAG: hypothetical protein JEZ12_26660 [Desulfobacterium sp.]|nr:hypothetical protein [Desulfobacterium sp.]